MNTNESFCPKCGKPVSLNAFEGLCPGCLLQAGFGTITQDGDEKLSAFIPPTPEELARHFPQLEIIELLGRGGMGAVYKARQVHLDRIVALKILPPSVSESPAFAERFVREARALAKLHHPNIVTLYESGQADDLFYFLMEFVDGINLRQLLATGNIATKDALAIVPQICDALQFAHDRNIVHRDIKPENILLSKSGQVKIADFGVAKIVAGEMVEVPSATGTAPETSQTEIGKVVGTPQYMAPEQVSHPLDVDNRADIYALGVVFYQMLTGELPAGKFSPPSSKVQIDVRLDDIVLRALQKQPELRYQQASVMKTQVETIAGAPLPSPSLPPTPRKSSDTSKDLTRVLISFFRFLLVGLAVFTLTILAGAYITYKVLPKVYTASAQIQVHPRGAAREPSASPDFDHAAWQAEFEIMQSPEVLLPIINNLNLDKIWAKKFHKTPPNALPPLDALAYLYSILRIDLKRGTNIIEISVSSGDPREAADIANAVADQYRKMRVAQENLRIQRGEEALRDQVNKEAEVVDQKRIALETITNSLLKKGISVPSTSQGDIQIQRDELEKDLLVAREDYDARQVLLKSVSNLPDDQFLSTLDGLGRADANITKLRAEIFQLQSDISKLTHEGLPMDHPQVRSLQEEIKTKQGQLTDLIAGLRRAMQLDVDMAKSRVALLQKQVDDLKNPPTDGTANVLAPYQEARHGLLEQQSILDALNLRLKQVRTEAQMQESPVRIISRAEPPVYPSSPNHFLYLIVTTIFAFLLALVVSFLIEFSVWFQSSFGQSSKKILGLLAAGIVALIVLQYFARLGYDIWSNFENPHSSVTSSFTTTTTAPAIPMEGAYVTQPESDWSLYLKKDGTAYYYSKQEVYSMTYTGDDHAITFTFTDGITDHLHRAGDMLTGDPGNKILGDETHLYHRNGDVPPPNGLLSSVMKQALNESSPEKSAPAQTPR